MSNPIRIDKTTTPTQGFLKNKSFYIGTTGDYGPTSATGFYASITPPYGGYALYESKSAQGPSIRIFNNSSSLSTELSNYFGHSFNFVNEGIVSASLDSDIAVLNRDTPKIPSSSTLQYYWDSNLAPSSISGSTRIFSMGKSESEGTMSSGLWAPSGQSGTSGSWAFNGTSTSIVTDLTSNSLFTDTFSVAMWVRIPTTGSGDFLIDKSDGDGLSHNGFSIELSTATIGGTEYASWLVTIDGETEFYTRTLASVFPYDSWALLVWSFEDRRDTFWLGQDAGTPNEVTYTRDNSITNITATNALTFAKHAALSQDYLLGSIGTVALFTGKFDAQSVKQYYTATKNYYIN
jgi:hypothetical protein